MKKDKEYITLSRPILTYKRANGQYLFDESDMTDILEVGKNIIIPLVADTEFWQPSYNDFLKNDRFINFTSPLGNKYKLELPDYWQHGRYGVTSQIKGIYESEGVILAHQDLLQVARQFKKDVRHQVATSGFDAIDYLNQIDIKCTLNRSDTIIKEFKGNKIPICEFVLYSHFALAEFLMLVNGLYKQDLQKIALSNKSPRAEMQRRMRVVTESKHGQSDSIELPWRIRIEDQLYRVKICIIDTFAIHGVASYKDFCQASNIKLEDKNKMDAYKNMMHIGYFELPIDYDKYSLGDLSVYDAAKNNSRNFEKIWDSLGIKDYFQPPRLTIGATVRDIFVGKVAQLFNLNPNSENLEMLSLMGISEDDKIDFNKLRNKLLDIVCKQGTAEYLKTFTTSTKCLNAKVEGGRCRNNRPNLTELEGVILDIDWSGCYGEGQRNQLYPFGNPLLDEYDSESKINKYPSLRQWLKKRKYNTVDCELVPGLWQARVSTKEVWENDKLGYARLKFPQDYLSSWFDFKIKDIAEMKTDSETQDAPINEQLEVKTGLTKIFNYQVINGIITHDFIDWLFNVCGVHQRNDLLDNLYIHTAMYYPAYDRVNSPVELLARIKNHEAQNESNSKQIKKGSQHTKITRECTAWYAVNMGEFIIDDLLAWRKMFPKKNKDGSKNAMNTLYKLCVNTLYGDMVSPFFSVSNVVVGNNITARARAACYYVEKGFNAVQSITDGGQLDILKVVFPPDNRKITAQSVVNLHQENDVTKKNLRLSIIGGYDEIRLNWIEIDNKNFAELELIKNGEVEKLTPYKTVINGEDTYIVPAMQWIDKKAIEHLQVLFDVDVLQMETTVLKVKRGEDGKPIKTFLPRKGQFEFESKSFYDKGIFHGSANYHLMGKGGNNLAMRSYEKKTEHEAVYLDSEESVILQPYLDGKTPAEYFMSQLEHPDCVNRSKVFIKQGILKINDARAHNERWSSVGRVAGDSIQKSGLLREFSLSQFTFQTLEQYKNISREVESNKRKFNQSYEGYFINSDGTLNFKEMIIEIDYQISLGVDSLNKVFDKHRHRMRTENMVHPESEPLEIVRNSLLKPKLDNLESDFFNTLLSDESGYIYVVNEDDYFVEGAGCMATDEDIEDAFSFL
jgi:hypothetical protein